VTIPKPHGAYVKEMLAEFRSRGDSRAPSERHEGMKDIMFDDQADRAFLLDLAERIKDTVYRYSQRIAVDADDADRLIQIVAKLDPTKPRQPLPPVVDGGKL
jgi:hypothetical protein